MIIKFHTLRSEQWVPRPIEEVFAFFSDPRNLEALTPPWLNFHVILSNSVPIAAGTEIRYRLGWHGVPIRWTTEIRRWNPPHRFVDVQRSGPYKLWSHMHTFESLDGGTKIRDVVRYALPFGILGRMVHAIKVRADVARIFEYRKNRIQELFGLGRT